MLFSMFLKWRIDTYMVVALIVLPILIVILDLHEEVNQLKEESKHQRKFVMDRYTILNEKMADLAAGVEKKLVVDFTEFAKDNPPPKLLTRTAGKKLKKKKRRPEEPTATPESETIQAMEDHFKPPETPVA
jgi:hypothetical protein